MKASTFLKLIAIVLILIVMNRCAKEEYKITSLPIDEVQSSYYILGDSTLEIPHNMLNSLLISRSEDELILKDDIMFEELDKGHILVTDFATPAEDVLHREVLSVEKTGGQLILQTQPAKVLKTFKTFYFNSELNDVIKVRNVNDLKTLFSAHNNLLNQIIGILSDQDKGIQPFKSLKFEVTAEFEGQLSFIAEHPNNDYVLKNLCVEGIDCDFDQDEEDSDGDGIYDVIERHYNADFSNELYENGFYSVNLKNFRLSSWGLKVGPYQGFAYSPTDSIKVVYNQIKELSKDKNSNRDKSIFYRYLPTPATFFGIFTFNAVVGPIAEANFNASVVVDFSLAGTKPIDVKFANVRYGKDGKSLDPTFEVTQDGREADFSEMWSDAFINVSGTVSGSIEKKLGIAVGGAITVGEANKAGTSFGAVVEMGLYSTVKGEGGVKGIDVFNIQNKRSYDIFGEVCVDFGLFYDLVMFTDANIASFPLGDALDYKLKFPKESLGLKNFSFVSYFTPPNTPELTQNGLCIKTSECDDITLDTFRAAIIDNDQNVYPSVKLKFKLSSIQHPDGTFAIKFKHGNTETRIQQTFEYGLTHTYEINGSEELLDLVSAIYNQSAELEVNDVALECNKTFDISLFGFMIDCDGGESLPLEPNSTNLSGAVTLQNMVGQSVTYFLKEEAIIHCQQKGSQLMSSDEILNNIEKYCINPTGYLLPQRLTTDQYQEIDINKIAIWVPDDNMLSRKILLIELDNNNEVKSYEIIERPSQSVYATCMCE